MKTKAIALLGLLFFGESTYCFSCAKTLAAPTGLSSRGEISLDNILHVYRELFIVHHDQLTRDQKIKLLLSGNPLAIPENVYASSNGLEDQLNTLREIVSRSGFREEEINAALLDDLKKQIEGIQAQDENKNREERKVVRMYPYPPRIKDLHPISGHQGAIQAGGLIFFVWNGKMRVCPLQQLGNPNAGFQLTGEKNKYEAAATDGVRLFVADGPDIYVWNSIPTRAEDLPNHIFTLPGSEELRVGTIKSLAATKNRLIVLDKHENRLLVYDTRKIDNSLRPLFELKNLTYPGYQTSVWPGAVATNGQYLVLADTTNNRVVIWSSLPTVRDQIPDVVLGQKDLLSSDGRVGINGFMSPIAVQIVGDRLFVADYSGHRVLLWEKIPKENGAPADHVIGQPTFLSTKDDVFQFPSFVSQIGQWIVIGQHNGKLRFLPIKDYIDE